MGEARPPGQADHYDRRHCGQAPASGAGTAQPVALVQQSVDVQVGGQRIGGVAQVGTQQLFEIGHHEFLPSVGV